MVSLCRRVTRVGFLQGHQWRLPTRSEDLHQLLYGTVHGSSCFSLWPFALVMGENPPGLC